MRGTLILTPKIDSLSRQFGRVFDAMTRQMDEALGVTPSQPAAWPAVNLWHDDAAFHLEAELPGFSLDEVEVTATENLVTVRGRRERTTPEGAETLRVERELTHFERTVGLPLPIDPSQVEATLTNGVLRVTMPKAESARPRKIEVRALSAPESTQAKSLPANAS
ncbi:MAG TPA: Hsp20/alpha crystallin family protein [Phycisphaerales bacterium]|nr:Hsp20/alpha crystallin family protein [Phycisphaerales bacterium]